jgi:hypothetical protein
MMLLTGSLRSQEPTTAPIETISVEPSPVHLRGPDSLRGLLVHGHRVDGRIVDLTHAATYRSPDNRFLDVNQNGVVSGIADGMGTIEVTAAGITVSVPVQVSETAIARQYHFENDVVPILSKFRCNSSGCHGKAEGQNGFKLSVFGFDPSQDYDALTKEGRGRRVFAAAPLRSLLLTKASGGLPHGGGIRFSPDSREYRTLLGWIESGAPVGDPDAAVVQRIEISPIERVMDTAGSQQLRVVATYSDGQQMDVTQMAKYQSNNDGLAAVDDDGLVSIGRVPGQVAVMATYMGAVDTFQALIPRSETIEDYPALVETNFIDELVHARLRKLNIIPSPLSDDAEFVRRAYLDVTGTIPTAKEARRFLDDSRDNKRAQLVNELLERPEYADFWALKWADLLRVDRKALGHRGAHEYYRWIQHSFAENKPLDQFARELLTVKGRLKNAPQANFYRVINGAGERASAISQVFLGVRIACAECHHHPFDRWSQTDYYGMTAMFSQVQRKATPRSEFMTAAGDPETNHPRTAARIFAHPLGEPMPPQSPDGDRREVLADWMTSPENKWFAPSAVNRVWAHLMGRGLVEPVDDFRDTNPPTNADLLDALAQEFVASSFDVRQLFVTIMTSNAYQRSSRPNHTNLSDEQNYSRALLKRVDAEVLLDAVSDVTGITESFRGVPDGYRAVQLWDSEVEHYFLKLFGRPTRKTACACERGGEPNVSQVLHVLNSPEIHAKLSHEGGRVARLVETVPDDEDLVNQMYLTFFARRPDTEESSNAVHYLKTSSDGRRAAAEDLAWSLMNTLEFIFNH